MNDLHESGAQSFLPTAPLKNLIARSHLLQELRDFFRTRSFIEVETPLLSADTVVDRYLEPVAVRINQTHRWLQTSPEFAMKRLIAAGMTSIFQITRAFRDDEKGPLHNPEFTILEWYQAGASYEQGMDFLADLCTSILNRPNVRKITYREAFCEFARIDPLNATTEELRLAAQDQDVLIPSTMLHADRDEWLNLILAEVVEKELSSKGAVVLHDYPNSQAALAKTSDRDSRIAERFELYVDGIELANGYHELVVADELRRRIKTTNQLRCSDGNSRLPGDSQLLRAMEHGLPACTGVALGVDRLLMVKLGASEIAQVMAFPFESA